MPQKRQNRIYLKACTGKGKCRMLKPAVMYKDTLTTLFAQELYSERYFYYIGYVHENLLPNLEPEQNQYRWVSVDGYHKVVGYFAYSIDPLTNNAMNFGLYSFDEGNLILIKDIYAKLEELIRSCHRVEWRVIDGNHARKGYEWFCKKHNGSFVCLHDVTKDAQGNYRNEYIYEVPGLK